MPAMRTTHAGTWSCNGPELDVAPLVKSPNSAVTFDPGLGVNPAYAAPRIRLEGRLGEVAGAGSRRSCPESPKRKGLRTCWTVTVMPGGRLNVTTTGPGEDLAPPWVVQAGTNAMTTSIGTHLAGTRQSLLAGFNPARSVSGLECHSGTLGCG